MIVVLSLVLLFMNYVTVYNDIKLDLRNKHSHTFLRKNSKGALNKLFFISFIRDIKKFKFILLILNYALSMVGLILQVLLTFDIVSDTNIIIIGFVKFMIIYAVTLFIYKLVISRILIAFIDNHYFSTGLLLFVVLVYVIIFIIVPIYQKFYNAV